MTDSPSPPMPDPTEALKGLVEAAEPFVAAFTHPRQYPSLSDMGEVMSYLRFSDFRRLRAALSAAEQALASPNADLVEALEDHARAAYHEGYRDGFCDGRRCEGADDDDDELIRAHDSMAVAEGWSDSRTKAALFALPSPSEGTR